MPNTEGGTAARRDERPAKAYTARNVFCSILAGVFAAFLSIAVGSIVVAPLVRLILGPPAGFQTDVTSTEAYFQGMLSNGVCLFLGFAALGYIKFGVEWVLTLIVVNPITLALGCIAFSNLAPFLSVWDYGYVGLFACLRVSLLGVLLGLPAMVVGERFARHRFRGAQQEER